MQSPPIRHHKLLKRNEGDSMYELLFSSQKRNNDLMEILIIIHTQVCFFNDDE